MEPRVSIIVPCYNYGRFLAQAVDSLLEQTLADIEVIVVDDASTDETPQVLARYAGEPRVRAIRHVQNQRHIKSYNEALGLTRGRYVGILSADDCCLSRDTLARQVAVFEAHPKVGMVYTAYAVIDRGTVLTTIAPSPADAVRPGLDEFRQLMWGNYVLHSGTLLRRDVQEELGPYDERLTQCGDWDLWLRASARHDVGYIAEPLYAYRMHQTNMQAKGIPPSAQADQNVLALERGFAALPADVPADIPAAREAALRHALLQTAWFDLFNGRRARAWQGVAYALRTRPRLALGGELWHLLPRLGLMTLVGGPRYRRAAQALDRVRRFRARPV